MIENKIHKIIEHKLPFSTFLEERFKNFKKEKLSNYSESKYLNYILEHRDVDLCGKISNGFKIAGMSSYGLVVFLSIYFNNPEFAVLFMPLFVLTIIFHDANYFRKKAAKKLLKSEEYKKGLAFKIFEKTTVDKEVLEFFAKKYGKEETINLLNSNKNPTYENIYEAISIINKNERINKENRSVEEIVECLIS